MKVCCLRDTHIYHFPIRISLILLCKTPNTMDFAMNWVCLTPLLSESLRIAGLKTAMLYHNY